MANYDRDMSDLNLESLALPADVQFAKRLETFTSLNDLLKNPEAVDAIARWRRKLLENSMRLVPHVMRPFFKIADHCRATLAFKAQLDFYLIQDQTFASGVFSNSDGKFCVYLTSGLFENFSDDELSFVIGREMGHILFLHTKIPTEVLLNEFCAMISPREIIALHSWLRIAEVSADRAGLLCTKDVSTAGQAFFKITSGLTSSKFQFNIRDYMEDYDDLEKYIRQSPADRLNDLYGKQPLNPIRLRALELFAKSTQYHQLSGRALQGSTPDEEIEKEIQSFMNLMEPTYLDEPSHTAGTIREFIFLVGYMLAKSDGEIAESELVQLTKLLDGQETRSRINDAKNLSQKRLIDKLCALAEKLSSELPAVQRLNIVRDAFSVVSADGKILDPELGVMIKICGVLKIRPTFLDELLRAA